jgi:hypothetical protein
MFKKVGKHNIPYFQQDYIHIYIYGLAECSSNLLNKEKQRILLLHFAVINGIRDANRKYSCLKKNTFIIAPSLTLFGALA